MNNFGPMLNIYPDSIGGKLSKAVNFLEEVGAAFSSVYILPSLYHSDLDRGFCVVDYELNEKLATAADMERLRAMGLDLKLDIVLNHASVQSPQFKDLLINGESSVYRNFFIDWNRFWEGCGEMTAEGYIQPEEIYIKDMFFRKPGMPVLMVRFPDGREVPYWNTFYQKVWEENGQRHYLGQMDLNIQSSMVWEFYDETLQKLAGYGAKIVRLDAFAYAPKAPGRRNFMNEPETWDTLDRVRTLAERYGLTLLPEIHASYAEGVYKKIAAQGYMTYDFFLPGLILDAMENQNGEYLAMWANELIDSHIQTVNMLGCHDGIPLLDLKGILPDERIQGLIDIVVSRGGFVKSLHGAKNIYYQVNATYFSALGENEDKLLLARAIQMFMPGKPQVWYLDLLAGTNDYAAVEQDGEGGHKEINRTNYTDEEVKSRMQLPIVQKQIELLRFRNTHPAFNKDAKISIACEDSKISISWQYDENSAGLIADLKKCDFIIDAG
ncbi:MAG: alpha-amylase family glycosyl hydrolase [Clostridiales bacterium]|nr:alpha-amylase family glycosyl hydrolase [Clostridiales bacterium]